MLFYKLLNFKQIFSKNDITNAATQLSDTYNAKLFIVSVAKKSEEDLKIVGLNNTNHVLYLNKWRDVQLSDVNVIAKQICKVLFKKNTNFFIFL